jgi:hypothetical protein
MSAVLVELLGVLIIIRPGGGFGPVAILPLLDASLVAIGRVGKRNS